MDLTAIILALSLYGFATLVVLMDDRMSQTAMKK